MESGASPDSEVERESLQPPEGTVFLYEGVLTSPQITPHVEIAKSMDQLGRDVWRAELREVEPVSWEGDDE